MTLPEINRHTHDQPGVLRELPRRKALDMPEEPAPLSQMRFLEFKFKRLKALQKLAGWISLLVSFVIRTGVSKLRRRDSVEAQAHNLRTVFENRGGAFVKLGVHLAMRVDILPWAYCVELSKMTDSMAPFRLTAAIEKIERAVKMPLPAVFSRFDPTPIESTSTACIYQAQFHNKERVIVKVRRPGVGAEFMAALQAFEWLLKAAEFLTVFKPGFTDRIYQDYRNYLLEQLDFVQEARRQDSFRRSSSKMRKPFFSSPRVHLGLSNEEVVIEEFITGMWLNELVEAVEHNDETLLSRAALLNILPHKVAKRLVWVHFWTLEENLFFLSDPHPNSIIVGEDGKLYFIDFSNTGSLSRSKRQAIQQLRYYIDKKDPQNMARALLVLLEPLPPLDILELTAQLESYNWQHLYAQEAAPSSLSWQERTSAVLWRGIVDLAKKHGIIIEKQVLLLLKAMLVTESAAIHLYHDVDIAKVYRKFEEYRAEQARIRMTDSVLDQLDGEVNERLIIRMDRIAYTLQGLFFRTRHMLTLPSVNFSTLMGKWSFTIYTIFRLGFQLILLTGIAVLLTYGSGINEAILSSSPQDLLRSVFLNPLFQVIALVLVFANGRSVLFRLDDIDVK